MMIVISIPFCSFNGIIKINLLLLSSKMDLSRFFFRRCLVMVVKWLSLQYQRTYIKMIRVILERIKVIVATICHNSGIYF